MTQTAVAKQEAALKQYESKDYGVAIEQDDIQIPSLILLQAGTDLSELADTPWKKGQFYDMATDELLDKVEGLVVGYKVTARLFGPKQQNGRADMIRFSSDGKHWDDSGDLITPDEFKYREDGEFAKKAFSYLIIRKGQEFPVMVTFKGASAKNAKKLNSHLARMRPSFRSYFSFFSTHEEGDGNNWYEIHALPQPKKVPDEKSLELASEMFNMIANTKVANEELQEEAPKY